MELKGRRSLTEPEGLSDEAKTEEWSPEAADGRRLTKAEPEGRGSPVELVGGRATVETREPGAKVQPMVRRTEMESRTWRLEVEPGGPHAWVELEAGSPEAPDQSTQLPQTEGELRDWQEPAETE